MKQHDLIQRGKILQIKHLARFGGNAGTRTLRGKKQQESQVFL